MSYVSRATVLLAVAGLIPAVAFAGESGRYRYDVVWREPGAGGFSAPNALYDADGGAAVAIVACEGDTGVVCLSLDGNRLWTYPLTPPVTAPVAVADLVPAPVRTTDPPGHRRRQFRGA